MTVTVSLWNLGNGEIRLFAFQDAPEFRITGGQDDMPPHEVLEFLERAGLSHDEAEQLLESVLRDPHVHRRRFQLSPEQIARLREFAPELITPVS